MGKYCLSVLSGYSLNDGSNKPREDINKILKKNNYKIVRQISLKSKKQKVLKSVSELKKLTDCLTSGDTLIIHYPTNMGMIYDYLLFKYIKKNGIKSIALIHDIDSLRYKLPFYKNLSDEIKKLNNFDCVISPNSIMSKELKSNGLNSPTIELEIFDYLVDTKDKNITFDRVVSYAGNLNKSKFINELEKIKGVKFDLYGPIKEITPSISGLYVGSFKTDLLLEKLNKGFGLIWDGDSIYGIDEESVSSGSYLKYNNPYKLSSYIAAGLPVFIWNHSAEKRFVEINKIGYSISSIDQIKDILSTLDKKSYEKIVDNVKKIQIKVSSGYFTNKAIMDAESLIS